MPAQVLRKHGVIKQQGDLASLTTGPLAYQQRSKVRELCERKIQAFLQKRGLDTWADRMVETDPVPPAPATRPCSNRVGGAPCAGPPRTRSPSTWTTFSRGRGAASTSLRTYRFCAPTATRLRATATPSTSAWPRPLPQLARPAPASRAHAPAPAICQPLAVGHLIILPHRHAPDFLAMTAYERRDAEDLARYLKGELTRQDPAIEAFSLAADCGLISDRHTAHAQLHLVPRRAGDGLGSHLLVG